MTIVLALDASSSACSAALWLAPEGCPEEGRVVSRYAVAPREHTRRLLPMVKAVLSEAGVSLEEVDAMAYGRGPGAFTGIRIAAGMTQGLAFGAGCPVVAVSTLEAMALAASERHGCRDVLAALDARMGEVYAGGFHVNTRDDGLPSLTAWLDECVVPPDQLHASSWPAQSAGSGPGLAYLTQYPADLRAIINRHDDSSEPDAAYLVRLAARAVLDGEAVAPANAQPVYLRDQVAARSTRGPLA